MKLDHLFTPHTRVNSKWIQDLNVRSKTIKILEENISSKISVIAHRNFFGYISPDKGNKQTNKINKWDHIKLKSFCTAKEINQMNKQPSDGKTYQPMIHLIGS